MCHTPQDDAFGNNDDDFGNNDDDVHVCPGNHDDYDPVPDLGVDDDDFLVTVPVPGNHDIILCLL